MDLQHFMHFWDVECLWRFGWLVLWHFLKVGRGGNWILITKSQRAFWGEGVCISNFITLWLLGLRSGISCTTYLQTVSPEPVSIFVVHCFVWDPFRGRSSSCIGDTSLAEYAFARICFANTNFSVWRDQNMFCECYIRWYCQLVYEVVLHQYVWGRWNCDIHVSGQNWVSRQCSKSYRISDTQLYVRAFLLLALKRHVREHGGYWATCEIEMLSPDAGN